MLKNLSAMREIWVQSLDWEDPLEEGMATHSSILAWRVSMDKGAWWATVHLVGKESDTNEWLSTICLCVCVCVCVCVLSHDQLFATPVACSPPGSTVHDIFQARYWSRWSFPSPGNLPSIGRDRTWVSHVTGWFFTTSTAWEALNSKIF